MKVQPITKALCLTVCLSSLSHAEARVFDKECPLSLYGLWGDRRQLYKIPGMAVH